MRLSVDGCGQVFFSYFFIDKVKKQVDALCSKAHDDFSVFKLSLWPSAKVNCCQQARSPLPALAMMFINFMPLAVSTVFSTR
jgi:hypothetical protein